MRACVCKKTRARVGLLTRAESEQKGQAMMKVHAQVRVWNPARRVQQVNFDAIQFLGKVPERWAFKDPLVNSFGYRFFRPSFFLLFSKYIVPPTVGHAALWVLEYAAGLVWMLNLSMASSQTCLCMLLEKVGMNSSAGQPEAWRSEGDNPAGMRGRRPRVKQLLLPAPRNILGPRG